MRADEGKATLRRRGRMQQRRFYRSRAIGGPKRSKAGNGKCSKADFGPYEERQKLCV